MFGVSETLRCWLVTKREGKDKNYVGNLSMMIDLARQPSPKHDATSVLNNITAVHTTKILQKFNYR